MGNMTRCPWFGLDSFLTHAGAVENRRQENQEHTHELVECREHIGRWHVVPRRLPQAGAA